jgi:hypothetical protein
MIQLGALGLVQAATDLRVGRPAREEAVHLVCVRRITCVRLGLLARSERIPMLDQKAVDFGFERRAILSGHGDSGAGSGRGTATVR